MKKATVLAVALCLLALPAAHAEREISGSTVSFDGYTLHSPTDLELNFTVHLVSSDAAWFYRVSLNLPAAWVITSLSSSDGAAVTGGVGTNVATFAVSDGACPTFGFCMGGCTLTVHVDPNGVLTSQTITYMMECDTYSTLLPMVVCSPSDPCSYDGCYDAYGTTGLVEIAPSDLTTGPVPVELQAVAIE